MSDTEQTGSEQWDPEEHETIGDCILCGEPVYPAGPAEDQGPQDGAMHRGCGW